MDRTEGERRGTREMPHSADAGPTAGVCPRRTGPPPDTPPGDCGKPSPRESSRQIPPAPPKRQLPGRPLASPHTKGSPRAAQTASRVQRAAGDHLLTFSSVSTPFRNGAKRRRLQRKTGVCVPGRATRKEVLRNLQAEAKSEIQERGGGASDYGHAVLRGSITSNPTVRRRGGSHPRTLRAGAGEGESSRARAGRRAVRGRNSPSPSSFHRCLLFVNVKYSAE